MPKDVSFGFDTILYNPEFASLNIRSRMLISSHRRCFIKKDVLKNFAKFTGKHLHWSLFMIKPQGSGPVTLLKTDSNTGAFLWICEVFKNTLFTEHLRAAVSGCSAIGVLSGVKPDPDFARSVIAHHCFLKHFISPDVILYLKEENHICLQENVFC